MITLFSPEKPLWVPLLKTLLVLVLIAVTLASTQAKNVAMSMAADTAIIVPDAFRLSREGRLPVPAYERQFLLDDLQSDSLYQVFQAPPCLTGNYYLAFQLEFDLGNLDTESQWQTDMELILMGHADTIWRQSTGLDMLSQNFVSTVFHDSLLTCSQDIQFAITNLNNAGIVPLNNIYLNILMFKEEENNFDPNILPALNYQMANGTAIISWGYASDRVEAFDLEWVFIAEHENFTGTTAVEAFMYKEPVRVTIKDFYYTHLTNYPDGRLWYRIRAIGYSPDHPTYKILGKWAYGTGTAISYSNHEPQKNWHQRTFFAEEGKYKKVMSYRDGTLRERQVLTNMSSQGTTFLEEVYYDFEGRKAVQVLPGPVLNNTLNYFADINRFEAIEDKVNERTTEIRKKFNYDNGLLGNSIVSYVDGAGRYFSPANGLAVIHRNYIPDAEGYVYEQTEYVNDGTGRISKQSGVGKTFRIDGEHATKYYYGNAAPAELIRLFGTNAGNATHYKKNLAVDPNGQVVVTYLDQEGRTVATALAGEPPINTLALESYHALDPDPVTVDLSQKNKFTPNQTQISHKILNVSPNTSYTFRYNLSALGVELANLGCQTCTYALSITLTDIEGRPMDLSTVQNNESLDGKAYIKNDINALSCTDTLAFDVIEFTVILPEIGDYTITKTLTSRQPTYEEMISVLMKNDSIMAGMQHLIESYTIDSAACEICTSCPEAETAINEAIEEVAQQDCENIYQQIIQYYQDKYNTTFEGPYEVSQDSIMVHPLYCQYELCSRNTQSSVFEKQVARWAGWSSAEASNYTDLITLDPFFNDNNLSGFMHKSSMQDKLNNVNIGSIQFDSNEDGIPDGANPFIGSLMQVTDPYNTSYYINKSGNPDTLNGWHILYFDFMERRDQLDEETYQKELDFQRWSLYKSFYFEAKRKTKLEIPEYQNCTAAKEDLEQVDGIPQTPEGLEVWGEANGINAPVSREELEMIISNLEFNCAVSFSPTDSAAIANHLESYFNNNRHNFFRFIIQSDLQSSVELLAIQSILNNYDCSLSTMAQDDPLSCVEEPENWVVNPQIIQNGLGNCPPSDIVAGCYEGWSVATGTPNTDVGGGQGRILLWGYPEDISSEAIRGTFVSPLEPGQKYELCLKYAVYTDTTIYTSPIVDNVYMQLSRSQGFLNAKGILGQSMNMLSTTPGDNADSLRMKERKMTTLSRTGVPELMQNCFLPRPQYPDAVILQGQTTPSEYVWFQTNAANAGVYKDTCIVFTPTEASTYFYLAIMSCTANTYQAVNIKDIQVRKITAKPNGIWYEGEYICLNYDTSNASLSNFSYTVDWEREIALCEERAAAERDRLVGLAIEKYLDGAVSNIYNRFSASCFDKAEEELNYTFDQKEYHYTLYYYDQSDLLVQTVPPKGVAPLSSEEVDTFLAGNIVEPLHKLMSKYRYNSLNQLVEQHTPDAGMSRFWYDRQGQLRLSQNARQVLENQYAYSKYDEQGRIIEIGEMDTFDSVSQLVAQMDTSAVFPLADDYAIHNIVRTYYDHPSPHIQQNINQEHLRNRIAWTEVIDNTVVDTMATYYSYDAHGNIKTLLQQLPHIGAKRTDYIYDQISGNVNYVLYQYGEKDEFIHRYKYDADNRLTEVYTSSDGFIWDRDAYYFYYFHGPLARINLGQYNIQGLDYYYTLQGWLKGMNMPYEGDLAQDGLNGSRIGKDVLAFELGYYDGDYKPINPQVAIAGSRDGLWAHSGSKSLFNGNIAWMVTDLPQVGVPNNQREKGMQAMLYQYDQLQRIKSASSLTEYTSGTGFQTRNLTSPYDVHYAYDPNGNLLTLQRRNELNNVENDFDYKYYAGTNRLMNVEGSTEQVYQYDATGNLTVDTDEGMTIDWTPYGKVQEVIKTDSMTISFRYDAAGNRIQKTVMRQGKAETSIYVRDATGNVLAIYKDSVLVEQLVYGNSRLGIYRAKHKEGTRTLGHKNYELTNHLGNVLAVVTDNIHMDHDSTWASAVSVTDYYPFGLPMAGRSWNDSTYRYGFQRQEKIDEIYGSGNLYSFDFRESDPRLGGQFWSIDPLAKAYPGWSPYAFAQRRPIDGIELEGLEWKSTNDNNGTSNGYQWDPDNAWNTHAGGNKTLKEGYYHQAIFFSENGTHDASSKYNMGSSTATVFKADGTTQTFDATSYPSDLNKYPTVPEGIYEANVGLHKGSYTALRMHSIGNTNSRTELGFENPAFSDGRTYATGINIHKPGLNNLTGLTSKGNPCSAGCMLVDRNNWGNFIGLFNTDAQRNNTVGVTISRTYAQPIISKYTALQLPYLNKTYFINQPDNTRVAIPIYLQLKMKE